MTDDFAKISNASRFRQIGGILILAIAYYVAAEISRSLASTPQDVTPVWPPDGIAVGAVLLFGNRIGYGVFLGSFFANFWAFQDSTNFSSLALSTLPVLGIALGTTLGTLFGVFLWRRSTHALYPLASVGDIFKFLVLAGMVGPSVNATVGVTCLALNSQVPWSGYGTVWLTWWISNVSGVFIVAPILLSWGKLLQNNPLILQRQFSFRLASANSDNKADFQDLPTRSRCFRLWLATEGVFLLGLVILVSIVAFDEAYQLQYMLIPVLIWSTFRLGEAGTTLLNFIAAAIAVIATVNGKGSFAVANTNQSLIQLQLFIGVVTLTVLALMTTIAEQRQAKEKLRLAFVELARTNEMLEVRVQQRTEELNEKNTKLGKTIKKLQRTQMQVLQSEKMSALGQLIAGIAHEINNPINFVHGNLTHVNSYIQDLLKVVQAYRTHFPNLPQTLPSVLDETELDFLQEDLTEVLKSMRVGTDRIRNIVLSLRNFSRLDQAEFKTADLHEGIDNTLMILQHRLQGVAESPPIEVMKNYGQLPSVECYPGQLNQVFMHLLVNAIDALENSGQQQTKPGTIWISTQVTAKNQVQIEIADNALGIPTKTRSRIFDPFFTTKPIGKGTGLGLSISYQIVTEQHRGKIWCHSTLGEGSKFVIELPIHQPRAISH